MPFLPLSLPLYRAPRKTKTQLLHLPNELLLLIAKPLDVASLSSFSRSSQHLHNLLTAPLYSLARTTRDAYGRQPLHWASEAGNLPAALTLLSHGCDADAECWREDDCYNRDLWRPLQLAALKGHVTIVQLLLAHGADVKAGKYTALHKAAYAGHEEIVCLLLKEGADIDAANDDGFTALYMATYHGHDHVAKRLLECGADIEARNSWAKTPLVLAAWEGHEAFVRTLLVRGADVSARSRGGVTALHGAAAFRREAVVRVLLETEGVDVNAVDDKGWTPLHRMAFAGHINESILRMLVERGADRNIRDREGRTARAVYEERHEGYCQSEVVRELLGGY